MVNTIAPMIAVAQRSILKLDIIPAASLKTMAFTTKVNSPRVRMLIGKVSRSKIGLKMALSKPTTRLATIAALKSLISNPLTSLEVMSRARAERIQVKRIISIFIP